MAKNFCLLPNKVDQFKQALINKEIKMSELLNMSSEQLTEVFSKYAGSSAKDITQAFEEKRILKNKTVGMKNLLNKLTESGRYSPSELKRLEKARAELRAAQQERILSPKEEEVFLNELADKTVNTHVTRAEAKNVYELTKKTQDLLKNYDPNKKTWSSKEDAFKYGASKYITEKYVESLSGNDMTVKEMLEQTVADFKNSDNKGYEVAKLLGKAIQSTFDNSVSLVASLDNSFLGRQGLVTAYTHPTVWLKTATNSFVDFAKTIKGGDAEGALFSDIYSRPNYIDGTYKDAGLLKEGNEQFPSSLPERIPGLGRVYKGSEAAFKLSDLRTRLGLYDILSASKEKLGIDMATKENKAGLGTVINSMVSKGQWGKKGEGAAVKLLLWSPRMIKANLDFFTAHAGQNIPKFAKVEARKNLAKFIAVVTGMLGLVYAIDPSRVDPHLTSSNFGKIRIGKKWIDITGGKAQYIVLAARLMPSALGGGKTTSAQTGITNKFGEGYKPSTRLSTVIDFLLNKVSPGAGTAIDFAKGQDHDGKKPTIASELYQRSVALTVQQLIKLKDDHEFSDIAATILDAFGLSASGYDYSNTDWSDSTSKKMTQFKSVVGEQKFKEANKKYNDRVNSRFEVLKKEGNYKSASDEEKQAMIDEAKSGIKSGVFSEYNFVKSKQTNEK